MAAEESYFPPTLIPTACSCSTLQQPSRECQISRQTHAVIEPCRGNKSRREKVPGSLGVQDREIGVTNSLPARIDLGQDRCKSSIPFGFHKCRGANEGRNWREGDHMDSFGHFLVVCGTIWDAKKGGVIHLVHPVDATDVVKL